MGVGGDDYFTWPYVQIYQSVACIVDTGQSQLSMRQNKQRVHHLRPSISLVP